MALYIILAINNTINVCVFLISVAWSAVCILFASPYRMVIYCILRNFFIFCLDWFFSPFAVSHYFKLHSDVQGWHSPALLFPSAVAALYRPWELFLGSGSGKGYAEKVEGTQGPG
jgi:hypothetical protein